VNDHDHSGNLLYFCQLNSIFLLLGDQIYVSKLVQNIQTTAIALTAIIVSRALTIYGLQCAEQPVRKKQKSRADRAVVG